jgi:hypothetical protein
VWPPDYELAILCHQIIEEKILLSPFESEMVQKIPLFMYGHNAVFLLSPNHQEQQLITCRQYIL